MHDARTDLSYGFKLFKAIFSFIVQKTLSSFRRYCGLRRRNLLFLCHHFFWFSPQNIDNVCEILRTLTDKI